ncbi:hypothetical protein H310_09195 [Aphanomyces invadans]|uniref:Trafficking protein particle complex subunit 2-like protein n=1 Tax=Aphanomyces invadans TaxID=157072 RepID=A0A024TV68_9STRA|nr:hypothetical protein H310_09195 [Aphanomyces invadans]ETV97869.1 hypothetical protein H310_09195 [Aphanomyces invadans]|eukprot:XP_008873430.1 hypothetical protein H310_09195 [Aphanomyces invadans]
MIACVAIVGANNNPLFVRAYCEDDDLSFHYIAHIALDIVEERVKLSKDDMYLGFLGPVEDFRVYGYVTNTLVKLIAVVQDAPLKDSDMRAFFADVHKLYVNAMSNPFAILGERITSAKFESHVKSLVLQHNQAQEAH